MTNDDALELGEYIQKARKAKGWGVRELARQAGIDASVVIKLEAGHARTPHVHTLKALASALEVPTFRLFTAVGYDASCNTPCLGEHLRACYGHLSEECIERIERLAEQAIEDSHTN